MIADRVMQAVPNPGNVGVGSVVTLGSAPSGYRSFLSGFGANQPAYFILTDGAGRALSGIWTVNSTTPQTATVTAILGNDRLGGTAPETFAGNCTAWNEIPAVRAVDRTALDGIAPYAKIVPVTASWNGSPGYAAQTTAETYIAHSLPDDVVGVIGSAYVRCNHTGGPGATLWIDCALYSNSNTLLGTIATAYITLVPNLGLWGNATIPIAFGNFATGRHLRFRAWRSDATATIQVHQYYAGFAHIVR